MLFLLWDPGGFDGGHVDSYEDVDDGGSSFSRGLI